MTFRIRKCSTSTRQTACQVPPKKSKAGRVTTGFAKFSVTKVSIASAVTCCQFKMSGQQCETIDSRASFQREPALDYLKLQGR